MDGLTRGASPVSLSGRAWRGSADCTYRLFQVQLYRHRRHHGRPGRVGHDFDQANRVDLRRRPEFDDDEPALPVNRVNSEAVGEDPDTAIFSQIQDGIWRGAVPIAYFFDGAFELRLCSGGSNLSIHH